MWQELIEIISTSPVWQFIKNNPQELRIISGYCIGLIIAGCGFLILFLDKEGDVNCLVPTNVSETVVQASTLDNLQTGNSTNSANSTQENINQEMRQTNKIAIDVAGAVRKPGMYWLSSDSRVDDALKAAGGLSNLANTPLIDYQLNRAQQIYDGTKIYLPHVNEDLGLLINSKKEDHLNASEKQDGAALGITSDTEISKSGKTSINNASLNELDQLSGIGQARAEAIIKGRPFQNTQELVEKKIIPKSTYDNLESQLEL